VAVELCVLQSDKTERGIMARVQRGLNRSRPERVRHRGAGEAGLRQKQTLDLIALRTEPFERMGTDAAAVPMEKIKCIGARKLLHVRERVIAEVDRGIVAQHVAKLPIQSKATTDCEHLSL